MLISDGTLVWLTLLILSRSRFAETEVYLWIPFIFGIVPGLLFYVETRFKIYSELWVVLLHLIAFEKLRKLCQSQNFLRFITENKKKNLSIFDISRYILGIKPCFNLELIKNQVVNTLKVNFNRLDKVRL